MSTLEEKSIKANLIAQLRNDVNLRRESLAMAIQCPGNLSPGDVIRTANTFVDYIVAGPVTPEAPEAKEPA